MDICDFLGNKLTIGDTVAVSKIKNTQLFICEIIGFTPKKIQVSIDRKPQPPIITIKDPSQVMLVHV